MNSLLLRPSEQHAAYHWALIDANKTCLKAERNSSIKAIAEQMKNEKCHAILIIPASATLLQNLKFSAGERRHIMQTAPYMLEDHLIEAVEDLHFALAKPQKTGIDIAMMRSSQLKQWLEPLREAGVKIGRAVAEQQWLAPSLDTSSAPEKHQPIWEGYYDGEQLTLRASEPHGFGLMNENLKSGLELLASRQNLPNKLYIAAPDEATENKLKQLLPETLAEITEIKQQSLVDQWAQQLLNPNCINLLSGRFVSAIPWREIWRTWRITITALAATAALACLSSLSQIETLQKENLHLRQTMQKIYAQVFPNRPAPVDMRGYLESQLRGAKRISSGESFIEMLDKVGKAIAEQQNMSIDTLNYDSSRGLLRLGVIGNNFQQIEDLRIGLVTHGLKAKLQNSSAENNRVRARLLCERS